MNRESFPSSVREIICYKKPVDADRKAVVLGKHQGEWEQIRKSLSDLCCRKGLDFKLLEDNEKSE